MLGNFFINMSGFSLTGKLIYKQKRLEVHKTTRHVEEHPRKGQ